MAELLGEFGRQGENGVGHPFIIGPGIGQAPPGQKRPVHVLPDIVGVDEGAVHIKQVHIYISFSSQNRQGKSRASSA